MKRYKSVKKSLIYGALILLSPSLVCAENHPEKFSVTEYSVGGLPSPYQTEYQNNALSDLTEIYTGALPNQSRPLDTELSIEFSGQISVAEAASKVLKRVGYTFKSTGVGIDPLASDMYRIPLPNVHREFNDCAVIDIVQSLVGESYTVVVDHRVRALSVDVSPEKARILSMELRSKRQYAKRKEVGNDL